MEKLFIQIETDGHGCKFIMENASTVELLVLISSTIIRHSAHCKHKPIELLDGIRDIILDTKESDIEQLTLKDYENKSYFQRKSPKRKAGNSKPKEV